MVRKADLRDIEKIKELYIEGFKLHQGNRPDIFEDKSNDELIQCLKEDINKKSIFYVYEYESKLIGYISFHYNEKASKSLWIDELVVDSKYRNKGVGTNLMNEIRKIARENDCDRIEFCCWSFNENAMKLYEKLGYKRQGVIFEEILENNIDK